MNPYSQFPSRNFWRSCELASSFLEVGFDSGKKFDFSSGELFATSGSCFAQHFGKRLMAQGGSVLFTEVEHPLYPPGFDHGYGLFSARYGNIYTVRQLRELLEQACSRIEMVGDWSLRKDGRVVDLLRPRAVPMGFDSVTEAAADRAFHLGCVRRMLEDMTVFVFTLGLTEAWMHARRGHTYPVVPGSVAGDFDPGLHVFKNFGLDDIVVDLHAVVELVHAVNPSARILFTVSPVSLVATAEPRSVVVSTVASKSILRAAVEQLLPCYAFVDYFPSYEIITSPLSRGRFWLENGRDVTDQGVRTVMDVFFSSRLPDLQGRAAIEPLMHKDVVNLSAALDAECDELFLDPKHQSSQA